MSVESNVAWQEELCIFIWLTATLTGAWAVGSGNPIAEAFGAIAVVLGVPSVLLILFARMRRRMEG